MSEHNGHANGFHPRFTLPPEPDPPAAATVAAALATFDPADIEAAIEAELDRMEKRAVMLVAMRDAVRGEGGNCPGGDSSEPSPATSATVATSRPELRERIVAVLDARGPTKAKDIAAAVGVPAGQIALTLQHAWFVKVDAGLLSPYRLTVEGAREAARLRAG